MRARVYIITEGGRGFGFGHITRCVALRQAFEQVRIEPIFIVNGDASVGRYLKKGDLLFNWNENAKKLLAIVRGADIAVVDSYVANRSLCEKISAGVKVPVYLDDNNRINYPSGAVVNFAGYAERLKYPKTPGVAYYLGKKYTLLRKAFWKQKQKHISKDISRILITFGGSDPASLTGKTMAYLAREMATAEKVVVVSDAFQKALTGIDDGKTRLVAGLDAAAMKKLYLEADLLVSASGQTLYEAAALGLPTIAVCVADNQSRNYKEWLDNGFVGINYLAKPNNYPRALGEALKKIAPYEKRKRYSDDLKSGSNPAGAVKLVERLLADHGRLITIRPVKRSDSKDLWRWRNDLSVRRWCFSKGMIKYSNHQKWFSGKIMDKNNKMYVACDQKGRKVGQIRFEGKKSAGLVNVNLNPKYFGRGYGSQLIKFGTWAYMSGDPKARKVIAEIADDNQASRRAFELAGYQPVRNGKSKVALYEYKR